MCTHHFIAPDGWSSTNWGTVETALRDAYQAPGTTQRSNIVALRELRWYRGELDTEKFVTVHRISSGLSWAAGGSGALPGQVACTVTEVVEKRNSWGRFYLPTLGISACASTGRVVGTTLAGIAAAWQTAYNAIVATGMEPVVKSSKQVPWDLYPLAGAMRLRIGVPTSSVPAYLPITAVQVDDIFDVIRSRRHSPVSVRDRRSVNVVSS